MHLIRRTVGLCAVLALAAACGGDGDDDATTVTPEVVATDAVEASPEATDAAPDIAGSADTVAGSDDSDAGAGESPDQPAPDGNSGTVTVAGTTYDLTADDFLICETVNPAFDDAINVQTRFDVTPGEIVIHGDTIQERMELGLLGELPDDVMVDAGDADLFPHSAEEVDVTRDGRTVSGAATIVDERSGASVTEDNPLQDITIEFSFTC